MKFAEAERIMGSMPHAFAHHQIVADVSGEPCDYIFLYINKAFEKMTGLKKEKIIGKKVTEVLPDISSSGFDWINEYGKVSKSGKTIKIKQYSEPLKKWYEITAFSDEKGFFSTLFSEITENIIELESMKELVRISERSFKAFGDEDLLSDITEAARRISGSKFTALNLYDDKGETYYTQVIAGLNKGTERLAKIIGYDPVGKVWRNDARRAKLIEKELITGFDSLEILTGKVIDKKSISSLVDIFDIGKTYICKIMNEGRMLGDFTIFMKKGESISESDKLEILASIVGQYLERKKASEELERFFDINLDLLCIADTSGNFIRINESWQSTLGYPIAELKKRKFLDFVHPDDQFSTLEVLNRLSDQEDVLNFVNRYKTADGSYRWIEWRSHPKGDLVYAAARDITERVLNEEKLKISENKIRQYIEQAPMGIFITDKNGNYTTVNAQACELTGFTREELLRSSIKDFMDPRYHDKGLEMFQKTLKEGYVEGEVLGKKKNGKSFWGRLVSAKIGEEEIIGFVRDITAEKESRDRIDAQHAQMLSIFDNIQAVVYVVDMESYEILFINRFGEKDYGNILGKKCWEVLHPEEKGICSFCPIPGFESLDKEKISSASGQREIYDSVSGKWHHCIDSVIKWTDGRDVKLTVSYDITERKEAEKQNRFISTVMMNACDSVVVTDEDFKINYVNRTTEDLFGYTADEMIGMSVVKLYELDEIKRLRKEVFPRLKQGKRYSGEFFTVRKDGAVFICELKVSPLLDEKGIPYAYVGIQRDVTEQRQMFEELKISNERFEATLLSVGDAIIATDKKANITVINNVAEYLTGWTLEQARGKPSHEIFKIINENTGTPCDDPAKEAILSGQTIELANHTALVTRGGRTIPIEDSAAPIKDKDGNVAGSVIVFRDYTEKRDKQRKVEFLSFHDYLTGLYNRRYMEDALIRLDTRGNLPFAIITADVNGLKLTNDAYGHEEGDALLKKVADILKASCSEDAIIARTGGDEFVILHTRTDDEEAQRIKENIQENSSKARLDSVIISLAVGYAVKTKTDQKIKEIMKEADNRMYKNKIKYGKTMRNETIELLLRSINNKYDREQIHTERVCVYCEAIAKELGLSPNEIDTIKVMATLHDIGKITVSPDVLNKKTKLTEEEWREIKKHSVAGYNILKSVDEYASIAEAVLYHHERWDGTGYPSELKGEDIPLYSRIISVADGSLLK